MSLSSNPNALPAQQSGKVYLSTKPDRYTSIFEKGQVWEDAPCASMKAEIQRFMRNRVFSRIDDMISRNIPAKEIYFSMRGYALNPFSVEELYDESPMRLDEHISEHALFKFKERTGIWLAKIAAIYIRENDDKITTAVSKYRPPHLDSAPMKDIVVDGVLWNPVYFRRFLPFQFVNKIINCRIPDNVELFNLCNSTYSPHINRDGAVFFNTSQAYITPEDIREKGYPEEAALHESFGDMQIVKSAIVYYERAIILRKALHGEDVLGEISRVNEAVRHMTKEDVIEYLKFLQTYFCDAEIHWLASYDYEELVTGLK